MSPRALHGLAMVAARSPAMIDPEMIIDTPPARQRRDIGSSTAAKDGDQKTWTGGAGYDRSLGDKNAIGDVTRRGNHATGKPRTRLVMNASDTAKIQRYLRQRFGNHKLSIARRETKDDSAELMLEDEFIGVVFQDDEDGETCYHVQISILEEDLQEA